MRLFPFLALAAAAAHLHVLATGPSRGDAPTEKPTGTGSGVADSESFPDTPDDPALPPPVDRLHNWGIYEPARCVITSMGSFWWDPSRRMFWASPNGRRAPHIDSANTFGTRDIRTMDPIRHGLVADWAFDTAMRVEGQPWRDLIPVLRLRGDDAPPCKDTYRSHFLMWDPSRVREIGTGSNTGFTFTDETARYIRGLENLVVALDRFVNDGRDTIDRSVYLPVTDEFLRAQFGSLSHAQDEFTRWVREHLVIRGMINMGLDVARRARLRAHFPQVWRHVRQVEWFGHGFRGVAVDNYAANKDLVDLYITLDVPIYFPWPEGGEGVAPNHRPHPTVITDGVNDRHAVPDFSRLPKKAARDANAAASAELTRAAWGFSFAPRKPSGAPGTSGAWDPGDAALGVGQAGYKKGQAKDARFRLWVQENQHKFEHKLTRQDYKNRNDESSDDDSADDVYFMPRQGPPPGPGRDAQNRSNEPDGAASSSKRPREDEQLQPQESPKRPRQDLPPTREEQQRPAGPRLQDSMQQGSRARGAESLQHTLPERDTVRRAYSAVVRGAPDSHPFKRRRAPDRDRRPSPPRRQGEPRMEHQQQLARQGRADTRHPPTAPRSSRQRTSTSPRSRMPNQQRPQPRSPHRRRSPSPRRQRSPARSRPRSPAQPRERARSASRRPASPPPHNEHRQTPLRDTAPAPGAVLVLASTEDSAQSLQRRNAQTVPVIGTVTAGTVATTNATRGNPVQNETPRRDDDAISIDYPTPPELRRRDDDAISIDYPTPPELRRADDGEEDNAMDTREDSQAPRSPTPDNVQVANDNNAPQDNVLPAPKNKPRDVARPIRDLAQEALLYISESIVTALNNGRLPNGIRPAFINDVRRAIGWAPSRYIREDASAPGPSTQTDLSHRDQGVQPAARGAAGNGRRTMLQRFEDSRDQRPRDAPRSGPPSTPLTDPLIVAARTLRDRQWSPPDNGTRPSWLFHVTETTRPHDIPSVLLDSFVRAEPGAEPFITRLRAAVEYGIDVHTLYEDDGSRTNPRPPETANWSIPPHVSRRDMLDAWFANVRALMQRPHARAFLLAGGLAWRIARIFLDEEDAMAGPSANALQAGSPAIRDDRFDSLAGYDDFITEAEWNILMGRINDDSIFPNPRDFRSSHETWDGVWSEDDEAWFIDQLRYFLDGAPIYPPLRWRARLRAQGVTRRHRGRGLPENEVQPNQRGGRRITDKKDKGKGKARD
ncbi:hypothetical protein EXIGLDRAFT_708370 [Exidia glandulosa HHB12029]|uniref:Uncharacterized protein n=1 Tax=Exidia glandulosa HHB12029 TaxID=1314781 RepID=A0A166N6P7_EXIGL|nr:hypothetical protein EXIGLDRAFT_708370 [Exidia glandulosa HHB12029]